MGQERLGGTSRGPKMLAGIALLSAALSGIGFAVLTIGGAIRRTPKEEEAAAVTPARKPVPAS